MKKILTIAIGVTFVFAAASAYACGADKSSSAKVESEAKVKQVQASVKPEVKAQTAEANKNLPACCAAAVKEATASVDKTAGDTEVMVKSEKAVKTVMEKKDK